MAWFAPAYLPLGRAMTVQRSPLCLGVDRLSVFSRRLSGRSAYDGWDAGRPFDKLGKMRIVRQAVALLPRSNPCDWRLRPAGSCAELASQTKHASEENR